MKKQLAVGEVGAQLFHALYPIYEKTSGRSGDFLNEEGEKIELKSDSYPNSLNFFMERYSNYETKSPGGPWQAEFHHCKWFVYMFTKEKLIYWFDTKTLINWLEEHAASYPVRLIQNRGWAAQGYLVPRVSLESITHKKDILP